jgi:PleD family two-component response regulator
MTVKLGVNDYIIPKINFMDYSTNDQFNIDKTNNTPRVAKHSSKSLTQHSKTNNDSSFIKKEKILLIDDNHFINEATKNVLSKVLKEASSKIEIIVGSDGADMIHQVIRDQSKGNEIKCILTDENMEYINGSEAIMIIRKLEKCHKIKFINIISVTGMEDSRSSDEIKKAGAQLVLNKPLSKNVIKGILKDLNLI